MIFIRFFYFMFIVGASGLLHASDVLTQAFSPLQSSAHQYQADLASATFFTDAKKKTNSARPVIALNVFDNNDDDRVVRILLSKNNKKDTVRRLAQQIESAPPSIPSLSINQFERFLVEDPLNNVLPKKLRNIISDYAQLWTEIYQLNDPSDQAIKLAEFSPDSAHLVTVSNNEYRLWDTKTRKHIDSLSASYQENTNSIFSSDSNYIIAQTNYCIHLWNTKTKKCETFKESDLGIVSPDNTRIITTSWLHDSSNKYIIAYLDTLKERKQRASLVGHTRRINSAQFNIDGSRVVTASQDKTACLWNAYNGSRIAVMTGHKDGLLSARFSPDDKHIITASRDRTARLWNATNGESIATFSGHTKAVDSAQFSPDNTRILTTSWDCVGCLWDASTRAPIATLNGHSGNISAHFNCNSTRIVTRSTICRDQFVCLWNARNGSLIQNLKHDSMINSTYFSPDGTQLITATDNGTVCLWNADDGSLITALQQSLCYSARLNHDGTQIVTTNGTKAHIWQKVQL